jgi:Zn-dependent protease
MFISYLFKQPVFYVTWVVIVMFSICVHECCHAWTASMLGDDTASSRGYMTLNPLRVMGVQSLFFLFLFGFAWGAVPVMPQRLRKAGHYAWVAVAGPLANLSLLLVFAVGFRGMLKFDVAPAVLMCLIGMQANAFLLLFNLLPIPILDGWAVYRELFPPLRRISSAKSQQFGFIVLLIILFSGAHMYIWDMADTLAQFIAGGGRA